ncbi:MAG: response regulator, partial [Lachnospiraceae bacterium]|nr:response regulator [Lachnospiraceae bacterium]
MMKEEQGMDQQILIVDDDVENRRILDDILKKDYRILEAGSGEEALSVIEKKYLDIAAVILDLRMPGMDGRELLKIMAKDKRYSNLPILVVTGEQDGYTETECLEMGAWDFVA